MEWLKGKTHLPIRRQILSEICRLPPDNFVRTGVNGSQKLPVRSYRDRSTDKILEEYRPTFFQ